MLAVSAGGWLLISAVLFVLFLIWIYCLFDVIVRGNYSTGKKVVWIVALIVLAPLAIIGWFLFGRPKSMI
jgi:Phospholipase_D-nuclease N-terminal